jgi:hypothetical protein
MASAGDVFDHGRHGTSLAQVQEAKTSRSPPKPLLVAAPCDAGEYPVVVFLHGYLANNYFYSQLLQHVASHGFIVVGPQVLTLEKTMLANFCIVGINFLLLLKTRTNRSSTLSPAPTPPER